MVRGSSNRGCINPQDHKTNNAVATINANIQCSERLTASLNETKKICCFYYTQWVICPSQITLQRNKRHFSRIISFF